MYQRSLIALLAGSALSVTAQANSDYTVLTPTSAPYTRFDNNVGQGQFTDTFNFILDQASTGFIWLFARQDAWIGFDFIQNTKSVKLTLLNNDTGFQQSGQLFATAHGYVPIWAPDALALTMNGLDPNRSLIVDGGFDAGHYTASIEGLATGTEGLYYVAKFSFTPGVPESSAALMMAMGLAGVVLSVRRMKAPSHA